MTVFIDPQKTIDVINPKIHGQFIEFLGHSIDDGIWVGPDSKIPNTNGVRNDVLKILKQLAPPVIRWPGGCYADTYHWQDGIGPRDKRARTFNENFDTFEIDDHQFGTDEFLRLCEELGSKPWINMNMLSGSVSEMKNWMEYVNRKQDTDLARERAKNGHQNPYNVEMWGLGNEVWAGGGTMTPATYMDEYRRYASSVPAFNESSADKSKMYLIASGPDSNKPRESVKWTQDFFKQLSQYRQPKINGYDMHFYNWNIDHEDDTTTQFDEEGWNRVINGCLGIEKLIKDQYTLINNGLKLVPEPEGPLDEKLNHVDLIVGEWGNWHRDSFESRPALQQQVTMRDAITTALSLDVFQRNCDKVTMACTAQTANVLNSVVLTDGDKMVATPNFDVFMMYKDHQNSEALQTLTEDPSTGVKVFASKKNNKIIVDLVNTSYKTPEKVDLQFPTDVSVDSMTSLNADDPHDCNTFENPNTIRATEVSVNYSISSKQSIKISAASVNTLIFSIK